MLGYMNEKEALKNGFTHHGSYYGIPCWIAPDDDFMVATKWAPLECVMSAFIVIEQILSDILYPSAEPSFLFKIHKEIKK